MFIIRNIATSYVARVEDANFSNSCQRKVLRVIFEDVIMTKTYRVAKMYITIQN